MMRSPEQQYALAKTLPLSELQKVLAGQSDVVDMWVADVVGRDKAKALVAEKGRQAQQIAGAPKVVQRDMANFQQAQQMSQPAIEQGVAALPADVEVPDYAGGGIVAFQAGGQSSLPFASSVGAPLQSTRVPGAGPTFASVFGSPTARAAASRMPGIFGRIGAALSPMLMLESITGPSADDVTRLREFDKAKDILRQAGFTDKDIDALATPDVYRMAQGYGYKPALATAPATPTPPNAGASAAPPAAPPAAPAANVPPPAAQDEGLGALAKQIADLRKGITKPTLQSSAAEVEDMYRKAGVSMDPYAAYKKSLEEEKGKTAEERREAGWSRLLEAGLGIMGGTSPYALTNIGQGAQAAAKGAAEDIKEFRKLDRERSRALSQIAVAENELRRGITDKKIERYDRAREKYEAIDLKLTELQLGVDLEKSKLGITRGLKIDEIALKEANDQIQKEMVSNPLLAQDPVKYRQRLNELYSGFKSALSGKGLEPSAAASTAPRGRVVNGVYVPAGQ